MKILGLCEQGCTQGMDPLMALMDTFKNKQKTKKPYLLS